MINSWIPIDKIQNLLNLESFVVAWVLWGAARVFYIFFLKKISVSRHESLRQRFFITAMYAIAASLLGALYWALADHLPEADDLVVKISHYICLVAMLVGSIVVIKTAQIYIYLYLFFSNMSVGVPRLIANMFTLIFSTFIFAWIASTVFDFHLTTVLATSAIFSVVLGLALQDTLGNLFSGVALQLDKPYQLGDWVEVRHGNDKWVGQIQEINWRATSLIGFSDELILIPNKILAQSQLVVFSLHHQAARMQHTLRFRFDASLEVARAAMLEGLEGVHEVLKDPAPRILLIDVTESWIVMKIFYSIRDYGVRYRVGDRVLANMLQALQKRNIALAHPTLDVSKNRD